MDSLDSFQDLIGKNSESILWWQMTIRGVLVFLFGLVLIRVFAIRAFGRQSALDIVIGIVVGSNLSRAITANAPFVPTLIATAAIIILYWLFEHLAVRWKLFSRLTKGAPVPLIEAGTRDDRSMRRAAVSEGDIEEAARSSGMPPADIGDATLERSGKISVVKQSS
jgi:uncharacterized membrane protein YcaP (DUF421 family)